MKRTSTRSMAFLLFILSAMLAGQSLLDKAVPPEFGRRPPADKDGPLKGYVDWPPRFRSDATDLDKTDYWAAIAISPSTGRAQLLHQRLRTLISPAKPIPPTSLWGRLPAPLRPAFYAMPWAYGVFLITGV
jgi:hypothetical protein